MKPHCSLLTAHCPFVVEIFKIALGTNVEYTMFSPSILKTKAKGKRIDWYRQFIDEQTQKEGRYEVCLQWNKKRSHVVCVERKNGVLIWYDPQTGQKGDRLFKKSEVPMLQEAANIGIRRIDDKIINSKN